MGWTRGEKPPQCPLSARVLVFGQELMGWNCPLESPNASKTHVNYLPEGHFYRGFLLGGMSLRVTSHDSCLLGSLGFWFPINWKTPSLLGFYLDISCFEGFSPPDITSLCSTIFHYCHLVARSFVVSGDTCILYYCNSGGRPSFRWSHHSRQFWSTRA